MGPLWIKRKEGQKVCIKEMKLLRDYTGISGTSALLRCPPCVMGQCATWPPFPGPAHVAPCWAGHSRTGSLQSVSTLLSGSSPSISLWSANKHPQALSPITSKPMSNAQRIGARRWDANRCLNVVIMGVNELRNNDIVICNLMNFGIHPCF